jgi:acyl-CoA synthetase (AMP-forming)/AMP-acid ligase II
MPTEIQSLETLSAQALQRPAAQPVIEFQGEWRTWGDMRRVAERLAALIEASGALPRASIAFVARNRPSSIAALLGLIAQGRTISMLYAYQTGVALARDVERLGPALLVAAQEDFSDELVAVLRQQGIAAIALSEMDACALPGLEQSHTEAASPSAPPRIELLTSGTTGPPKRFAIGFDLIARHFVGSSLTQSSAASAGGAEGPEPPPFLLFMPLGNISGVYTTIPVMLKGQRAVLLERFTVRDWHRHVLRYRPQISGLPPAGVQMVLDADIPPADLACIRSIGTGAAPLDPTTHRAFEERYAIPILLSYGATEFAGPVTAMTADLHAQWGKQKFGSVGRPIAGAQLRVIDLDTDKILPPGQEGILEVTVPRMGQQWIRTSDIAVIDEDGFMYHRGRADGAIMRGGFKILPETIERALLLHDAISAVAVLGLPDQRLGQVPAAAIQLKPGVQRPDVAKLEAHLRRHVYATHIPAAWRIVAELPRTPSLKIDRPAVRRLFEGGANEPSSGANSS